MPQMPTPTITNLPRAYKRSINRAKDIRKPRYQRRDVGRVSTMELILSVTERRVYPGPITDCGWLSAGATFELAAGSSITIRKRGHSSFCQSNKFLSLLQETDVPQWSPKRWMSPFLCQVNSGFGFRIDFKYVVRGRVPNSSSKE